MRFALGGGLVEIPDPQPEVVPAVHRGETGLVASLTSERAGRVVLGIALIAIALDSALAATSFFRVAGEWISGVGFFSAMGAGAPLVLGVLILRGRMWPAWLAGIFALAVYCASLVVPSGFARSEVLARLPVAASIVAWLALTVLARRSGVTWPARVAMVLMTALLLARVPASLRAFKQNLAGVADLTPATRPLEELVGQPVPELAFQRLDGTWVQADRAGTLYLVDFWATWCAPCMSEMPELVRLHADLASTPGFEVISVLADPNDPAPESVLQKFGLGPRDVARDPQRWMRKLGIDGYPTKLLVRDGQVLLARSGGGRGAYELWRGIIERELAGAASRGAAGVASKAP